MNPLSVTFDVPASILQGLANGSLLRNGGVIQDTSGQVVMWLKELAGAGISPSSSVILPGIDPATGALNLAMQGVNAGISMRGFAAVTQQLNAIQGVITLTSAASVLSLGVSAIGFTMISRKLKQLEKRLKEVKILLQDIDYKVDLGFYSNFKAALDLAQNAFLMSKGINRESSAHSAINRFLEAEHVYTELIDKELDNKSQIGDEYLLTLCLAYIAEARCYLELGEYDTAIRRFEEGKTVTRPRFEKYVDSLLTPQPAVYLHPVMKDHINLSRLTRILQWKDPSLNENLVFENIRETWYSNWDIEEWINTLPASIIEQKDIKRGFFGVKNEAIGEVLTRLPDVADEMESMIETSRRFESYELEVKAITKLKVSYSEWLKLTEVASGNAESNIVCVIPKEPIDVNS